MKILSPGVFWCCLVMVLSIGSVLHAGEQEKIPVHLRPAVQKLEYEAQQNIQDIRYYTSKPESVANFVRVFLDYEVRLFLQRVSKCTRGASKPDKPKVVRGAIRMVLTRVFDQHLEVLDKERHAATRCQVQAIKEFFSVEHTTTGLCTGLQSIVSLLGRHVITAREAADCMGYTVRVYDGVRAGTILQELVKQALVQLQEVSLLTQEDVNAAWQRSEDLRSKQQEREKRVIRCKQAAHMRQAGQNDAEEDIVALCDLSECQCNYVNKTEPIKRRSLSENGH